ncbi:hypothetical protein CLOM_g5816 [Closterium sp. NIES-68]|nr:hypothetical protein CLOM_g5816 [Closterium sp. NIES-68]
MQSLTIAADGKEPNTIRWIIDCQNGMRKTYTIACVNDREVLSASIDPSTYPSSLVARPKPLLQLLNHFQPTLSEITIIAADPDDVTASGTGTGGGAMGRGGGSEAKAVEMRSYVEPTHAASSADGRPQASPEAAMHTQLWVDPGEHFEAYCHSGDAVDVTFSVREVKAFVQFCESAAADVVMLFHRAGAPLMLMPRFPNPHATPARNPRHAHPPLASDFDARLVIATMLESQLPTPPPSDPSVHRASAQPGTPPADQTAAAPQASAEAGSPVHKGSASQASAEAATPTVAVSGSERSYPLGSGTVPHHACPVGSGSRAGPRGRGLGEGMRGDEGAHGARSQEGAENVPYKDPDAGARLEAGWGHGKRWSDISVQGAKGTPHKAGADAAGPIGGEGSGDGRRGSNVWPRKQQAEQDLQQQDQCQQQQDQHHQQPANQLPDSEDATEELPIGQMAAAARGGCAAGAAGAAGRGSACGSAAGSAGGNVMAAGGAAVGAAGATADASAGRFMPTETSIPRRHAPGEGQETTRAPSAHIQRDPDRWIDNTEDDEMDNETRERIGWPLGEDQCEGIGDEDEFVDATPPERRMYDDDDETMD